MATLGASSLHPKIPFPAAVVQREVRAPLRPYSRFCGAVIWDFGTGAGLFRIESERLKLPAPFCRRISEPLDADAAGQGGDDCKQQMSRQMSRGLSLKHTLPACVGEDGAHHQLKHGPAPP